MKQRSYSLVAIEWAHFCYDYFLRGLGFGIFAKFLTHVPVLWPMTHKASWLAKFQFSLLEAISYAL